MWAGAVGSVGKLSITNQPACSFSHFQAFMSDFSELMEEICAVVADRLVQLCHYVALQSAWLGGGSVQMSNLQGILSKKRETMRDIVQKLQT